MKILSAYELPSVSGGDLWCAESSGGSVSEDEARRYAGGQGNIPTVSGPPAEPGLGQILPTLPSTVIPVVIYAAAAAEQKIEQIGSNVGSWIRNGYGWMSHP